MLVASPAYLERAGTPRKPADLSSHMLILGPSGMRPDGWVFRSQGKSVSLPLEGRLTISVNEVATSAALAGLGIASTAIWGCRDELEPGELARMLTDWYIGTVGVHAVRSEEPTSELQSLMRTH